jgi:serine/threonine protein kinase
MLQVMSHPHVVTLAGVSLAGCERFYVMPLFQRGSLRSWLGAGGRFETVQQVAAFVASIAEALSYAHSMNFIHRDLKPENILLSDDGKAIIADWGLGQFVHLHSKVLDFTRGGPMGTHYYCSLEQWASGRCDAAGDVYSLGVMLAELAVGFALPIEPIGSGILVDVVGGAGVGVQSFNATIKKMTALVAGARFQSMAEVSQVLRRISMMS